MEFMSVARFREEVKAQRKPEGGVFRVSTIRSKAMAGRSRRFVFSDGSVDRMGDTINPEGWDTQDFLNNPVALWAHDSSSPPIGRASGISVEDGRLMGDIEFAPSDVYAFAETIYRLVEGNFLNAVSVGFLPLKYSFVDNDPSRGWGIDFEKQELLEISVCPVPANANALAEARAKGIDTRPLIGWAENCLDGAGKTVVPKSELDRLRKLAKEPPMNRTRRRADGANEEDPGSGGALVGNCGRAKDDQCGMSDPQECSVHGNAKAADTEDDDKKIDPDDEKALRKALRKLNGGRIKADSDGDDDREDPPLEHEDSIRIAHRSLKTASAYMKEAVGHYGKAMDLIGDVKAALDDAPDEKDEDGDGKDPDPDADKAAQLAAAAARKARLVAV